MTETALKNTGGHTLRISQEIIPVHYLIDIDANWKFTDAAGHVHHCEYDAADHWPTLRRVIDDTYWYADCEDGIEQAHYECRACGEHITPGTTGPGTKMLTGLVTYLIDDQPVTKEQAQAFIDQVQR